MKVRFDFVTNSSSTSFVIICRGHPDRDTFLAAMGARGGSPLRPMFEELLTVFEDKMENARDAVLADGAVGIGNIAGSIARIVGGRMSDATAKMAAEAFESGKDVWVGMLKSDGGPVESFFCTESFEVNHPRLHVDANQCSW